jgi:dTDP-4-amino-4,6-dideoxygalactose transaminase
MELRKPAIEGGEPVRKEMLPYARHLIEDDDIEAVVQTLKSGWITGGPKIEEFENEIAKKSGAEYVVAVNSCTAALHIVVNALGIAEGHEVILPSLTFAASALAVVYNRAVPVFVDIDEDTLTLSPDMIEDKINMRTRAIMPVHYGGATADMDAISDIAARHSLAIVEDAAHAIGASYKGRPVGTLSNAACFSFHAVKNMTTIEGGAIATSDPDLAELSRCKRFFGIAQDAWRRSASPRPWEYDVSELGFKCNLSDIQAVIGISQVKKLDSFISRRRKIVDFYNCEFSKSEELVLTKTVEGAESAHHLYVIRIRPECFRVGRDHLLSALRAEGINANLHYKPVHLHSFFMRRYGTYPGMLPVTERAADALITLPLFPAMTDDDAQSVVDAVMKLVAYYKK